jgi:hypothetical protein
MKTDYYEIHVVVRAEAPPALIANLVKGHGFWTSTLEFDESKEEKRGDVIATTRSKTEESGVAAIRTVVRELREAGQRVTRYKIEHVILDSKHGDVLEALGT